MAADFNLALREWQFFARCHHDLGLDNVYACDPLGHRVLHLHPRVHLDKVKLAVLKQELESARTPVTDFFAG